MERASESADADPFGLGLAAIEGLLGEGLARGALHEVYALEAADGVAATGFAALLALKAAAGRAIVWVRQDFADIEMGQLYAPGLAELGFNPDDVFLVRARDVRGVLRASAEALRCAAVGAVVIEPWGEAKGLDLTASRKLSLSAAKSGVTAFLVRSGAEPIPSAATTRWAVRPVVSAHLEMDAPASPAFNVSLLRHRNGVSGHDWTVEWNRDRRSFQELAPLSRPVVPVPADRRAAPGQENIRLRSAG